MYNSKKKERKFRLKQERIVTREFLLSLTRREQYNLFAATKGKITIVRS